MLKFSDWSSQKVKVHGPRKVILGHFNDFGHFPIEIPIEVKKITEGVVLKRKQKVFRNL